MKYKNFKELSQSFKNGEIKNPDGSVPILWMDNDCCGLHIDGQDEAVFRSGGPSEIIHELLELLGIPSENC